MIPNFGPNFQRILEERTVGFSKPRLNLLPLYTLLCLFCCCLSLLTGYVYFTTFEAIFSSNGTISVPRTMTLNFFIKFYDFPQNHILYARSISYDQLHDREWKDLENCKPIITDDSLVVYPCGLISNTLPFDNILLNGQAPTTEGIAKSSHKKKIKPFSDVSSVSKPPNWPNRTGSIESVDDSIIDLGTNERYVNWIQVAAFSRFTKLFGRFEKLDAGEYDVAVERDGDFGRSEFILREKRWINVDSLWLPISLMVGGIFIMLPIILK